MNIIEMIENEAKAAGKPITPPLVVKVIAKVMEVDKDAATNFLQNFSRKLLLLINYDNRCVAEELLELNKKDVIEFLKIRGSILGNITTLASLITLLEHGWHDVVELMALHNCISLEECDSDLNLVIKHSEFIIGLVKKVGLRNFFSLSARTDNKLFLLKWAERDHRFQEFLKDSPENGKNIIALWLAHENPDSLLNLFRISDAYLEHFLHLLKASHRWHLSSSFEKIIASLTKEQVEIVMKKASTRVRACLLLNKYVIENPHLCVKCIKDYNILQTKLFRNQIVLPDEVIEKLHPNDILALLNKAVPTNQKPGFLFNPDLAFKKVLPSVITMPEKLEKVKDRIETLKFFRKGTKSTKEIIIDFGVRQSKKPLREVILSILQDSRIGYTEKAILIEICCMFRRINDNISHANFMTVEKEYSQLRDILSMIDQERAVAEELEIEIKEEYV